MGKEEIKSRAVRKKKIKLEARKKLKLFPGAKVILARPRRAKSAEDDLMTADEVEDFISKMLNSTDVEPEIRKLHERAGKYLRTHGSVVSNYPYAPWGNPAYGDLFFPSYLDDPLCHDSPEFSRYSRPRVRVAIAATFGNLLAILYFYFMNIRYDIGGFTIENMSLKSYLLRFTEKDVHFSDQHALILGRIRAKLGYDIWKGLNLSGRISPDCQLLAITYDNDNRDSKIQRVETLSKQENGWLHCNRAKASFFRCTENRSGLEELAKIDPMYYYFLGVTEKDPGKRREYLEKGGLCAWDSICRDCESTYNETKSAETFAELVKWRERSGSELDFHDLYTSYMYAGRLSDREPRMSKPIVHEKIAECREKSLFYSHDSPHRFIHFEILTSLFNIGMEYSKAFM